LAQEEQARPARVEAAVDSVVVEFRALLVEAVAVVGLAAAVDSAEVVVRLLTLKRWLLIVQEPLPALPTQAW
jgi:hypothetical protein